MKIHLLWWGRFDPEYSRNGVLRQLMRQLNIEISEFHPHFSGFADIEAAFKQLPKADIVWLPCFRQRDVAAARRWCNRTHTPLVFDPLISSYDKQIFERFKYPENNPKAKKLLHWEQKIFQMADHVIADTICHAQFFQETFGVDPSKTSVIYVGAEEDMFIPKPKVAPSDPIEVLFYGSYIPLHGAQNIIGAARCYQGAPVRWCMLGSGPAKAECEGAALGLNNLFFEPRIPYAQLPQRIHQADILLGVFGSTDKAARVMPNKVFQALAAGRPVITQESAAYPAGLQDSPGIKFIKAGSPTALAQAVKEWAEQPELLKERNAAAAATYQQYLSSTTILTQIKHALGKILNSEF